MWSSANWLNLRCPNPKNQSPRLKRIKASRLRGKEEASPDKEVSQGREIEVVPDKGTDKGAEAGTADLSIAEGPEAGPGEEIIIGEMIDTIEEEGT